MSKILTFALFFLFSFTVFAQESNLPSGNSRIVLKNKTSLKYVKLWKEHENKIEFERDGSLSDVMKDDVAYIECEREILTFDEKGSMQRYPYGLIVRKNHDTIFCTRLTKDGGFLSYIEKGKDKPVYIAESSIASYVIHSPGKKQEPAAVPLKKDSVSKADTAKNNSEVIQGKKTEPLTKADSLTKNNKTEEKASSPPSAAENDCNSSYERGRQDAKLGNNNSLLWGAGGAGSFCLTGGCGFPAMPMIAASVEQKPKYVPGDVQPDCYTHGYKYQQTKQNVRAASVGGFVGLGLFFITYLFIAVIGNGI